MVVKDYRDENTNVLLSKGDCTRELTFKNKMSPFSLFQYTPKFYHELDLTVKKTLRYRGIGEGEDKIPREIHLKTSNSI